MIYKMLQVYKVSARQVPRQLTPWTEGKTQWVWQLGPLLPAWNKADKQIMPLFRLIKAPKIIHTSTSAEKKMTTVYSNHQVPLVEQ